MGQARSGHSSVLLPNGRVLIGGGYNGSYLKSAELYDPATGVFRPTGTVTTARSGHIAVLLGSGKVLLAGGVGVGWTFLDPPSCTIGLRDVCANRPDDGRA